LIGATGDIGQAVAVKLDELGYRLTLTYNSTEPTFLPQANWMRLDVRDASSVRKVADAADRIHGASFALVYCTGVVRDAPLLLLKEDAWDDVMDVNLKGAFLTIQAVLRPMMTSGRGRIVLIGSAAGRYGMIGQSAYSASKAALEALCRVVARETGRFNVTCNVVAPGAIESRMFRNTKESVVRNVMRAASLRRLGEPRHVAGTVAYLLSEEADFLTGQTVVVDGGLA
jgi:3-oxoacyl-[acyl-carrier protein] reductase